MPDPGAGFLLTAVDEALGDAGLAITVSLLLIVFVVLPGFGFRLAGATLGIDAKFVPDLPAAIFCLGTGFTATVAFGLALLTTAFGAGAAGFLTNLTVFLGTGLAAAGLALDLTGAFLPLAALGFTELAGLLFVADLTGFLTGFLTATLALELPEDFPAGEDFAFFVFAILGTLL